MSVTARRSTRLISNMISDTTAAFSICIWLTDCDIMTAIGFGDGGASSETAEIVIIELTKKYTAISYIVNRTLGTMTSVIMRILPTPIVLPTDSRSGLTFPSVLYIIRYGEAKKWIVFASTMMKNVPYIGVLWKKMTYDRPRTRPGIATDVMDIRCNP